MIQVIVEENPRNVEIVVEETNIQAVISPPDDLSIEVTEVSGLGKSGAAAFVWNETPAGVIDGSNAAFTLNQEPLPDAAMIYRNGLLVLPGVDYLLAGSTVTFLFGHKPQPGDVLSATYGV